MRILMVNFIKQFTEEIHQESAVENLETDTISLIKEIRGSHNMGRITQPQACNTSIAELLKNTHLLLK